MLPQLWPFVLEGGGQQTRFQAEGFWYQPDVQHLERRELDKHIHDTVVVAFSFFFFFFGMPGFGGKVQQIIPCLSFFFQVEIVQAHQFHILFLFRPRISPQWLSDLRQLWPCIS